jgi:hypothetical protein
MSKISQDFINDLGSLYENIHVRDQDFLSEESEYYEEETAELAEDIILSLALSMFSEGYTAETFVKFLASSEEEVILEKYLTDDVTFISEETIYSDFVEEQLELLEAGGLIKLLGRGIKAAARGIKSGAKATKSAVKKGVTKAAEAGVERRVGKQLIGRKGIDISVPGSKTGRSGSSFDRTTAALERLSKSKATKAGIDVPSGKLDPRQSTELLKRARTARAIKGVKDTAKMALAGGLGVLGGYTGAKMSDGGKNKTDLPMRNDVASQPTPSQSQDSSPTPSTPAPRPSTPAPRPSTPAPRTSSASTPTKAKPKSKDTSGLTPMQQWAKNFPELAKKVKPGQSGYEEISKMNKAPTISSTTNKNSTNDNAEKYKEKLKDVAKNSQVNKEEYEIVLEYLIDTEQVDTLEEAHYVMMEMDYETVETIVEDYEDYLLAEEIEEWVNDLVEEGYDLSEYTWDDIVEYYISESIKE